MSFIGEYTVNVKSTISSRVLGKTYTTELCKYPNNVTSALLSEFRRQQIGTHITNIIMWYIDPSDKSKHFTRSYPDFRISYAFIACNDTTW